jgi:glucosyl-3-phosphoglycerate synthase
VPLDHGSSSASKPDVWARRLATPLTMSVDRHGRGFLELERELSLRTWLGRRSYDGASFTIEDLMAAKRETISIVLPARNVAATIGSVVGTLTPLQRAGLVDEIVVVDAASTDGTAEIAARRGVTVLQESDLMPDYGPARGKGDAMWRGVSATSGEIVLFIDTDTEDFGEVFALGMLGPLLTEAGVQFVKGSFTRPFRVGDVRVPHGGGRVTELVARPLINLYVPELAAFTQPLAGETAARRSLLESLSFPVGYGVEIAMMIDTLRLVGIDAMAQADLGTRQNRHQSLRALSAMAQAVLVAATARVHGHDATWAHAPGPLALPKDGSVEVRHVPLEERPPLRTVHRPGRVRAPSP